MSSFFRHIIHGDGGKVQKRNYLGRISTEREKNDRRNSQDDSD